MLAALFMTSWYRRDRSSTQRGIDRGERRELRADRREIRRTQEISALIDATFAEM